MNPRVIAFGFIAGTFVLWASGQGVLGMLCLIGAAVSYALPVNGEK